MNRILGAGPDAMLFAPTVLGSGKNDHNVLGFETSGTTRHDAESAASAGIFNNYREPLVRQFFFHSLLHLRAANLAARETIMATAKHERNDFCHGEQPTTNPRYLSGVGRAACD